MLLNPAPHIPRTRSFVIEASVHAYTLHMASSLLLRNPVPSLEHLEMHSPEGFVGAFNNFPLPNLTKLDLRLLRNVGPLRISSLLRLCSNCPQLQKVRVRVYCQVLRDVNRVIPLDLLVELGYTCHTVTRILPFLGLPHLKRLQVFLQARNVDEVSVFSPHDGQQLPCRTFTL